MFGIIFFIGCQNIPATDTQEVWTFFDATVGILLFPLLQVYLFSEHMHSLLVDEGLKIGYKVYQILGLLMAVGTFILVANIYIVGLGVRY